MVELEKTVKEYEAFVARTADPEVVERIAAKLRDPNSDLRQWLRKNAEIRQERRHRNDVLPLPPLDVTGAKSLVGFAGMPEEKAETEPTEAEQEKNDFQLYLAHVGSRRSRADEATQALADRVESRLRANEPGARELVWRWISPMFRVSERLGISDRLSPETWEDLSEVLEGIADSAALDRFIAKLKDGESELHRWYNAACTGTSLAALDEFQPRS